MSRASRSISSDDVLALEQYELIRSDKKQEAMLRKRLSSLSVGPNVTCMFESWDSMWLQIHEMLRIEKGGAAQLADELAAYDPMVPKGYELTMTLFFEVEDPVRRDEFLCSIAGVEDHIAIRLGAEKIKARIEEDVERTRARDNKVSAVQFLHFDFSDTQIAAWKSGEGEAMLVIDHPAYGHAALISAETRTLLARECF